MALPTITERHLDIARITDAAVRVLYVGKTLDIFTDDYILGLSMGIADATAQQKGVVSYSIDGQSATMSIDNAEKVIRMLRSLKVQSSGPVMIGVRFP
jgi:hypothetical protein